MRAAIGRWFEHSSADNPGGRSSLDPGISYRAVCQTIWAFEHEGAGALTPNSRGCRAGSGQLLIDAQEAQMRRLICEKRPAQLRWAFALRTRPAVLALIERECGITLSIRATWRTGATADQACIRAVRTGREGLAVQWSKLSVDGDDAAGAARPAAGTL